MDGPRGSPNDVALSANPGAESGPSGDTTPPTRGTRASDINAAGCITGESSDEELKLPNSKDPSSAVAVRGNTGRVVADSAK